MLKNKRQALLAHYFLTMKEFSLHCVPRFLEKFCLLLAYSEPEHSCYCSDCRINKSSNHLE